MGILEIVLILLATLVVGIVALCWYFKIEKKDFVFAYKGIKFKLAEKKAIEGNLLAPHMWERCYLRRNPEDQAIFYIDTRTTYTYGDIEKFSNQVAHFLLRRGLKAGDTIALYLENRPEYFMIWLGASKVGIRSALVNYNLKNKSLLHSLSVSGSKLLIYDLDLESNVLDIQSDLPIDRFCFGDSKFAPNFLSHLLPMPHQPVELTYQATWQNVKVKDPVLYVYTSGTTGLPKAAIVNHHRFWVAAHAFSLLYGITPDDRVYCTLPLYHTAGGIVALGMLLEKNATLFLRKKFSASNFISEVREFNCTVTQYIGELCRYILATPERGTDRDHSLRLAVGNGLRPEVWKKFQDRFGIAQIGEFYSATEGASALFNTENKFGAVGFISPLVQPIIPVKIVKFNHDTEELIRDKKGFCIPCAKNEPGEFIAKIYTVKNVQNFSGYSNSEASKKKIANDVFEKGDAWFRSGDLLKMDDGGFVYFVDRIGDTFRWKGENCSTMEVAEVISSYLGGTEVNVYGVLVPGKDGRAGMAAIAGIDPRSFDFNGLALYLISELPSYARPVFLRFLPAMEITGTFKHKKVELREQGFDITKVQDPIYFFDGKAFHFLDERIYQSLLDGTARV